MTAVGREGVISPNTFWRQLLQLPRTISGNTLSYATARKESGSVARRQNWAKSSQFLLTSQQFAATLIRAASSLQKNWAKGGCAWSAAWQGATEAFPTTFPVQGCANPAVPPLPRDHHRQQETTLTFSLFSSCSKGWKASVSRESEWFLFRAGLEPSRLCYNTEGTIQDCASVLAQAHVKH